ncbi:MAG: hypothetical protein RIF32_16585 [Leptospirales bacterium]|jgi:hypothetical protein
MRFKIPPVLLLIAAAGWLIRLALEQSWANLVDVCPNTDVLSWDANLRMQVVLDQYQDFRDGHWSRAILPLLDAPTWPPLRSLIALIVFAVSPGGPNTLLDVSISFVFYVLVFPSMLLIAFELTRDWLRAAVIFWFASVLVLQSQHLPVFGVSAMLESQGMFFTLWTLFFLHKVYERHEYREASIIVRERRDLPGKRRFVWGLLIFSQALFHTKYPYGVMLILAVVALELARNPGQIVDLLSLYFTRHYGGRKWYNYVLNGLKLLTLVVFVVAIATKAQTSAKIVKYALYAVVLIFFIDLQIYLYQYRNALRRLLDGVTRHVYLAVVFPAAVWMLIQPDRVSSILGTQQHVQDASRSFFLSIFTDVFDDPMPFIALLSCALLALTIVFARNLLLRNRPVDLPPGASLPDSFDASGTLSDLLGRPMFAVTLILVFQFAILEILTGNKQLRHIFHLIPGILVFIGAWTMRLPRLIPESGVKNGGFLYWLRRTGVAAALIFPVVIVLPVLYRPGGLLAGPASADYLSSRPMCFTGPDRAQYEPVRWMALRVDPDRRYVLVNSFHDLTTPPHARYLASEFDLLLRMRTLERGAVRNDSRYQWQSWDDFDRLLYLTATCVDSPRDAYLEQRAADVGAGLRKVTTHSYRIPAPPGAASPGTLCLREFQIVE